MGGRNKITFFDILTSSSGDSPSIVATVVVVVVVKAAVLFALGIRPNINEVALTALAYPTTPIMANNMN